MRIGTGLAFLFGAILLFLGWRRVREERAKVA